MQVMSGQWRQEEFWAILNCTLIVLNRLNGARTENKVCFHGTGNRDTRQEAFHVNGQVIITAYCHHRL